MRVPPRPATAEGGDMAEERGTQSGHDQQRGSARRERKIKILLVLGSVPMLAGLVDPLEGMFVLAGAGILVTIAAFMKKSRARWLLIAGYGVLLAALALMAAAGSGLLPRYIMLAVTVPWMLGGLLILAGDIWLIRQVVAEGRPGMADVVAAVLVALVLVAGVRIGRAVGSYKPWDDVLMTPRATAEGPGVRLILTLEDHAPDTEAAYYGAGVLENTSDAPITVAPDVIIDVIMTDTAGEVVWDGAERFWGKKKLVFPWDRPTTVAPGGHTKQTWELDYEKAGIYLVRAQVKNGPFAGLRTDDVTVAATSASYE